MLYEVITEKEGDAFELLNKNKKNLGALNLISIFGDALDAIKKLPTPDKVFIGGSSGELDEIISYLYNLNSKIIFVINAITLETLSSAIEVFKKLKIRTEIFV